MPLTVEETRRIATEVLAADHPALRVVGVKTEGGSDYAEIMVMVQNCHIEPCRLSLGVQRGMSEPAFRAAFRQAVNSHVAEAKEV
jgi:hypothetical protein